MSHHQYCCAIGLCCQRAEQEAELVKQLEYEMGEEAERASAGGAAGQKKYGLAAVVACLLDHYDLAPKGASAAIDQLYGPAFADKYASDEG